jgi:hypothetical protein
MEACYPHVKGPIRSLFDYVEGSETLDKFLRQFPSVRRAQVVALHAYRPMREPLDEQLPLDLSLEMPAIYGADSIRNDCMAFATVRADSKKRRSIQGRNGPSGHSACPQRSRSF